MGDCNESVHSGIHIHHSPNAPLFSSLKDHKSPLDITSFTLASRPYTLNVPTLIGIIVMGV